MAVGLVGVAVPACSVHRHRPNILEKKPPRAARASAISAWLCLPSHHWSAGTDARTAAMCWPHPAHVVFSQVLHLTGLHMSLGSSIRVGIPPETIPIYPWGYLWSIPVWVWAAASISVLQGHDIADTTWLTYKTQGSMTTAEPSDVRLALEEAHSLFVADDGGEVSDLYPPLASADPNTFGLAFVDVDGRGVEAGDSNVSFVLMSVAKPFTFALACDEVGIDEAARRIGVNATGLGFNSLEAVERHRCPGNPMVNAGAMATVGLLGNDAWPMVLDGLSRFAGHSLSLDEAVLEAVMATNYRNRALIHTLDGFELLGADGESVLDTYSRQCCVRVTPPDLASMGATLANGGINPVTAERVVSVEACEAALAVMLTAGLYETSGDWLYDVRLPGKSGVSGGIVGVSPGIGAFATYSPRIDCAANSVRGQASAVYLSDRLGLGILGGRVP